MGIDTTQLRALIIDMDGVLWRGAQAIGDLPVNFARIAQLGWRAVLATNNATKLSAQFIEKLAGFGVQLEPWQVISSAVATAYHLKQQHPQGGPVYIIGESGLQQALREQGFWPVTDDPLAVVVGLDHALNYEKFRQATLLIRGGVPFIGTNPDRTFPTPEGLVPGAGSLLALLEAATDVQPEVIGKPNPAMYRVALEKLGTQPPETLVIGDRLETDIAGAQALGCPTALVLSGVTSPQQAAAWQPQPEMIAADLSTLLDRLESASI
ncbi:MAG: HAD-IIA family hydrolase [Anaerolineales bacterium]|nr:HAD-IIA family hydrolase [Anaerolineales bacterium]